MGDQIPGTICGVKRRNFRKPAERRRDGAGKGAFQFNQHYRTDQLCIHRGIQINCKPLNNAGGNEALQTGLHSCAGLAEQGRQIGDGGAAIFLQRSDQATIMMRQCAYLRKYPTIWSVSILTL